MSFDLSEQDICKEKWAPWFKAGGWTVQDFTSPESARFQIPAVLNEIRPYIKNENGLRIIDSELKKYARTLNFPHDGEAVRGRFLFCFDYKYIRKAPLGIFAEKEKYDRYWSWHKPWFYLLIWVESEQKRYVHQIQDPSKLYPAPSISPPHYIITHSCVEALTPDMPIKIPEPMSTLKSVALTLALNRSANEEYEITPDDYKEARKILSSPKPMLMILRETRKLLESSSE